MKTKTLFPSLLTLALLFLCIVSYGQFSNNNSGNVIGNNIKNDKSEDEGGDGPFSQGDKFVNLGLGFVGSEVGSSVGSGYSNSTGPSFEFNSEKAMTDHLGLGFATSYQGASATNTFTTQGYDSYTNTLVNYTTTDKYSISFIQFSVRGAYHFTAGNKFDPYAGVGLGYCEVIETLNETTNDPSVAGGSSTTGAPGFMFGAFGGTRYFFSDHVGAWFEFQFNRASFTVNGYSTSISSSNYLNLGLVFKWR